MKIKYKNKQPMPLGYELKTLSADFFSGAQGPYSHIELIFETLNNNKHIIPFDVRVSGLLSRLSILKFAKSLKEKDVAECIAECLKYIKTNGTIMNSGYASIFEHTPIEVIESSKALEQVDNAIPRKYKHMAEVSFAKIKEDHKKLSALKNEQ